MWGASEQNKRMKLLISLGEFHMAADGFSLSKVVGIRKALRSVEFSGDTLQYTSELSRSFFGVLTEASSSFLQLFGASCDKPAIMSLLLQWIYAQVTAFVEVLARQIQLGINECAAVIVIQLRQLSSAHDPVVEDHSFQSPGEQADLASRAAASRRKSQFHISSMDLYDRLGEEQEEQRDYVDSSDSYQQSMQPFSSSGGGNGSNNSSRFNSPAPSSRSKQTTPQTPLRKVKHRHIKLFDQ